MSVIHFEGTCDVCHAPISTDWNYSADGINDLQDRGWPYSDVDKTLPHCTSRRESRLRDLFI